MKLIVDSVNAGASSAGKGNFGGMLVLIALSGCVALLTLISQSASKIVNEAQSAIVSDHIQEVLLAKSIEVDLEYYENSEYYETFHIAQRQAPFRPTAIINGLFQSGRSFILLVTMAALLLSFSWVAASVLAVAVLPAVFVQYRYSRKNYHMQSSVTPKERRAWYHHSLLTSTNYAKDIRLLGLGQLFISRYRDLREQIRKERLSLAFRGSAEEFGSKAIALAVVFGIFSFIAQQAFNGIITIGDMLMYFGAIQQGQSSLNSFLSSLVSLYENNLFLTALYQFLDLKPKVAQPLNPLSFPKPIKSGICFEHVGFSYPNTNAMVLKDINLEIRPGQIVALVGENGSGKTTLIKLLCRLYDPQEGTIKIDGIDLRNFRTDDLRREISAVLQDYANYHFRARENIWLGNVDKPEDMDHIVQAAECSGIDEAIKHLAKGYDTFLGRVFEKDGAELSIGEWQKVALARAFFRDSQVIILDEPTSSLDAKAEENVFNRFKQLAAGKMAIIISHRLSSVTMADRIYYIKEGRVTEQGTHQELMDQGNEYAQLFEIQAKHYRQ
ncbi:MAG: ABC transporter ATP-binding protein [Methanothrix sp.]|jgi:ATP-binding cassette subfamily B protein|uniref:ABC transporter ATP-binding protein n=1 Tax=Methanothrix sp. TaxID=90426 RepID=UPI003BB4D688